MVQDQDSCVPARSGERSTMIWGQESLQPAEDDIPRTLITRGGADFGLC